MAKQLDASAAEKKKLQDERKKLKADKKQQKKEVKKRAKEIAAQEAELSEDEESGGFLTFLATIAIILVWLGILCVVIKLDVGGFGSNVLTPLLKDVPMVNKILPNPPSNEDPVQNPDENAGYTNLADAVAQIKALELQLQQAESEKLEMQEKISEMQATIARLQEFEDRQVEFQRIQNEFYENVVTAEKGPGPETYIQWYTAMNPTTAEYIYRQLIEQQQQDNKIAEVASTFATMDAKDAAAIFEAMTDDLNYVVQLLSAMSASNRGEILAEMKPETAAKIAKIMKPQS